jgi:hypothetical protein
MTSLMNRRTLPRLAPHGHVLPFVRPTPVQQRPVSTLIMHMSCCGCDTTIITRVWGSPVDGCGLCPGQECQAFDGVCMLAIRGRVEGGDARLYRQAPPADATGGDR